MTQLAQLGLLSRFVGMLTAAVASCHTPVTNTSAAFCARDRSLGGSGRSAGGYQPAGREVKNICFNNARDYFAIELN